MLQRDYIERLIEEFARALNLLFHKTDLKKRRAELQRMYPQYVGPYDLLFTADIDGMMNYFQQFSQHEQLLRMEMLAELYSAEADTVEAITAEQLLNKAYFLYDYIQNEGRTLSFEHIRKMEEIKKRLASIK